MIIVVILSVLAGAVGGYFLATALGAQAQGKTFNAELTVEDKQLLTDLRADVAEMKGKVDGIFHISTTANAVAAAAAAPAPASQSKA